MHKLLLHTCALIIGLSALGQPAPINRRAFALSGLASTSTPLDILTNSMFLRWVHTDMTTGWVVTNNWVDRIQSVVWPGVAGATPTNLANGVFFAGGQYLDLASNSKGAGNSSTVQWAMLLIYNQTDNSATDMLIGDGNGTGGYGIQLNQGADGLYWVHYNTIFRRLCQRPAPNLVHDVLICCTNGMSHMTCFTNGVYTGADHNQGEASTTGFLVKTLAADYSGAQKFVGFIKEVIVWTNAAAFSWSSVNASNVHYYATNTYSYTP